MFMFEGLKEASSFYIFMKNPLGRLSRHDSFSWRSTASWKNPMRGHLYEVDGVLNSYLTHRDLSSA